MEEGRMGSESAGTRTEKAATEDNASGDKLRRVAGAIARLVSPEAPSSADEARWVTYSSDGIAAAAGSQYVAELNADEAFNHDEMRLAHQAVAETEGSWMDPDTFVATMERYHALKSGRDEH
jgi:hypothetical protein